MLSCIPVYNFCSFMSLRNSYSHLVSYCLDEMIRQSLFSYTRSSRLRTSCWTHMGSKAHSMKLIELLDDEIDRTTRPLIMMLKIVKPATV